MYPSKVQPDDKEWTLRLRMAKLPRVELAVESRDLNASFLRASSGVAIRASSIAALVKVIRTTTFNTISRAAAS